MTNKNLRALSAMGEIEKRHGSAEAKPPPVTRKIKAFSTRQPWASMIAADSKTIETRTWPTKHRGEILIASSKRPICEKLSGLPYGKAVAIANLVDCRPMLVSDEEAARCQWYEGAWAWVLTDIRAIEPFDVKGQLGIYEVEIPVGEVGEVQ